MLSNYGGEDLTHAFLYVLGLKKEKCISQIFPHHIRFLKNIIYELIVFNQKKQGGPRTCTSVLFRAWNAQKCMS